MRNIIFILVLFACLACDNESPGDCSVAVTVRDLTGLDGCRWVMELNDGSVIQPEIPYLMCGTPPIPKEIAEDPLYNFELHDGQRLLISYYETNHVNICMVGRTAKITCIKELGNFPEE
jgi:hypothetical protein